MQGLKYPSKHRNFRRNFHNFSYRNFHRNRNFNSWIQHNFSNYRNLSKLTEIYRNFHRYIRKLSYRYFCRHRYFKPCLHVVPDRKSNWVFGDSPLMMAFRSSHQIRALYRAAQIPESSYLLGSSRSYSSGISNVSVPELYRQSVSSCLYKGNGGLPWSHGSSLTLRSALAAELPIVFNDKRWLSAQVKAPAQARQMGALKVAMLSPGFIYEPYTPREKISFFKRWFTRSGWRRTKEDMVIELKSAYAIAKLRKKGYSKHLFYKEVIQLYKEINTLMANGDKNSLRKAVTERMFSELKNEIKQRDSIWSKVYWEMVEPAVKIRTLRARLIGVDRNDLEKVFIQLTLEFLTKQKFEAYDSNGSVVSGDKSKEVLIKDIWVFEKCLFEPKAFWRLCGRISL